MAPRNFSALLIALLTACGGDDGESDPRFPSDIRNDATLEEIGVQDFDRLCRTYRDWVTAEYEARVDRAACASYAVRVATSRSECDTIFDACMADINGYLGGLPAMIRAQAECSGVVNYQDCTTVLQLKNCLTALTAGLDEPSFNITCDDYPQAALAFDWWVIDSPDSCSEDKLDCDAVPMPDAGI